MISILYGFVRVDQAETWPAAKAALRKHILAAYHEAPVTEGSVANRDEQLARAAGQPGNGLLMTSGPRAWVNTMRCAHEGTHGLTAGDLCLLRNYSNGHRDWTINVKAKILAIGPTFAHIRITGESCQMRRYETRSVPLSFLRPRGWPSGRR
jgi:hypothetical protein